MREIGGTCYLWENEIIKKTRAYKFLFVAYLYTLCRTGCLTQFSEISKKLSCKSSFCLQSV